MNSHLYRQMRQLHTSYNPTLDIFDYVFTISPTNELQPQLQYQEPRTFQEAWDCENMNDCENG
jgi:hypothetical protein